jgi:type I restriction enzyme M protein
MAKPKRSSESRTESILWDLLQTQGYVTKKPPVGDLLIKQEYKDFPSLETLFKSKSGSGQGLPEGIVVDRISGDPLIVIEAKAKIELIEQATQEARFYAEECIRAGFRPLAIGIAGDEDGFEIQVFYWTNLQWAAITYDNSPINWIPTRENLTDIRAKMSANQIIDLRPAVPSALVLAQKAEEINRLLREAKLKDEYRPATVAAMMLALWQSRGNIRRNPDFILQDINNACRTAFQKAGKLELSDSLRVDQANQLLATKAKRICGILESLNITTLTAEYDYIGQLYEAFFRYTGGNTIGQYFTPRHIAYLATEMTNVTSRDVILDPACGTGGFLIAAMQRMLREEGITRQAVINLVGKHLIGFETEPVTAALCVANMIFRGDGTTGIHQDDSLTSKNFPQQTADIVLMNPPFPHKKTDEPSEVFINRGLQGLGDRKLLAAIVPFSLLVKTEKGNWRSRILKNHSLKAVISLPDELFQPYAAATTALVIIEKGVKNTGATFFARIENDGLKLKKGVRIPQQGSQIQEIIEAYRNFTAIDGLAGFAKTDEMAGWAAGAYIPVAKATLQQLQFEIDYLIRSKVSFLIKFATQVIRQENLIIEGIMQPLTYEKVAKNARSKTGTLGEYFNIAYGQKALHSKDGLSEGDSLIISSSGMNNGCYGFFDYPNLIQAPFVTVPSTGSIGEAHVQEYSCGVTDDCLILTPKSDLGIEYLYYAAAILRIERWRFNYGRKITPDRICDFPMPQDSQLFEWITNQLKTAKSIEDLTLSTFVISK